MRFPGFDSEPEQLNGLTWRGKRNPRIGEDDDAGKDEDRGSDGFCIHDFIRSFDLTIRPEVVDPVG